MHESRKAIGEVYVHWTMHLDTVPRFTSQKVTIIHGENYYVMSKFDQLL
jgi:hypothetical protein